jgi:hypothetical protein
MQYQGLKYQGVTYVQLSAKCNNYLKISQAVRAKSLLIVEICYFTLLCKKYKQIEEDTKGQDERA